MSDETPIPTYTHDPILRSREKTASGCPPARVLIVNHTSVMGGAEVGLTEWIRCLDRGLVEPVVMTPPDGALGTRLAAGGESVLHYPLTRFKRTRNPMRLTFYALRLSRQVAALYRTIMRHDIRLAHANSKNAYLVTAPAARLAGIPCIWHERDLAPLPERIGCLLYRQASAIVAVSQAVAGQVQRYRRGRNRVRVIYNGVDTQRFLRPIDRNAARNNLFPGIEEKTILVGMAANLAPWKRHSLFLDMAELLADHNSPELRFVLVGDDRFKDHRQYERSLRSRAVEGRLAGRVLFGGYREDMPAVMRALDILVHPTECEPFGRVLVEAMASGVPVVAANGGGAAEIVMDNQTGLLTNAGDAGDMAAAVLKLAKDAPLRRETGEAGRRRAMQEFDARRVGAESTRLYLELLKCTQKPY